MTGHTVDFIENELPYAQGLQYRSLYLTMFRGVRFQAPDLGVIPTELQSVIPQ
jgi:hypothetical protein